MQSHIPAARIITMTNVTFSNQAFFDREVKRVEYQQKRLDFRRNELMEKRRELDQKREKEAEEVFVWQHHVSCLKAMNEDADLG